MIIAVNGLLGSGKTTFVTLFVVLCKYLAAIERLSQGKGGNLELTWNKLLNSKDIKVHSNIKFYFPFYPLSIEDLNPNAPGNKMKGSVIALQEAYLYADARISAAKANRLASYFVMQTRKRDVILIYDSQFHGAIDNRIRDLADLHVFCYKSRLHERFEFLFVSPGGENYAGPFYLPFVKAQRFFKLFDSNDIVPIEVD